MNTPYWRTCEACPPTWKTKCKGQPHKEKAVGCFDIRPRREPLRELAVAQARTRLRSGHEPEAVTEWLAGQYREIMTDETGRIRHERAHITEVFGSLGAMGITDLAEKAGRAVVHALLMCSQPDSVGCGDCRANDCRRHAKDPGDPKPTPQKQRHLELVE